MKSYRAYEGSSEREVRAQPTACVQDSLPLHLHCKPTAAGLVHHLSPPRNQLMLAGGAEVCSAEAVQHAERAALEVSCRALTESCPVARSTHGPAHLSLKPMRLALLHPHMITQAVPCMHVP
jgi:hypothetical protein